MLKRTTKVTCLLVLVASIVSIIPAYADDVKKIDSTDGIIYNVGGSGSSYFIDGDIDGKGEGMYWMTADGTFHPLDIPNGSAYGGVIYNRYIELKDSDTYVDIQNNYAVIKDTLRTNLENDAQEALKKKIRSDDNGRFIQSNYKNTLGIEAVYNGTATSKFLDSGTGLAMYPYELAVPFSEAGKYTDMIYSDNKGNYVDADYNLGNFKVATTSGSVTIKNTSDTYELKDGNKTYELRAAISNSSNPTYGKAYVSYIAPNYYRWADISIYAKEKGEDDSAYQNVTSKYIYEGKYKPAIAADSITVLQQFSSVAAKTTIDGIKYSKSSSIYFVTDEDGNDEYPIGINTTYAIKNLNSQLGLGLTTTTGKGSPILITSPQGWTSAYLTSYDKNNRVLYAERLKLASKNGYNYIKLENLAKKKVSSTTSITKGSGSMYFMNNGYIESYDGKEFTRVYKLDGSMSKLYVGGQYSMLAYNPDSTRYVMIHSKVTATEPAVTATGSWVQASDGIWSFQKTDGDGSNAGLYVKPSDGTWAYNKADGIWSFQKADKTQTDDETQSDDTKASGWLQDGSGNWSYGNTDGTKASGWLKDGDNWYYLNDSGVMQTGWIKDNENWYYLNESGTMLSETTVNGYILGKNGAWVK